MSDYMLYVPTDLLRKYRVNIASGERWKLTRGACQSDEFSKNPIRRLFIFLTRVSTSRVVPRVCPRSHRLHRTPVPCSVALPTVAALTRHAGRHDVCVDDHAVGTSARASATCRLQESRIAKRETQSAQVDLRLSEHVHR